MKWLVVITLLAAGCFRDHPTATELAQTDCISCHQTDFAQSTQHQGQGSTACAACHDPNIMPPWAFAHPETRQHAVCSG